MGIIDKVVGLEKRIEKLATRKDVPAAPIEVRRAILDDVEAHIEPAGRSRKVFPYTHLAIEVVASTDDRAAFEAVLDPAEGLVESIRERLQEAGCARVARLLVTVKIVRKARAEWAAGATFRVTYAREEAAPAPAASTRETVAADACQAELTVLAGRASRKVFSLEGERINVGRQAEVTDKDRRIVRRNQVVFLDLEGEPNRSVSRAQAHITVNAAGDYRLFDDHSTYGTRILRGGRTIELPSGSPRGIRLQPDDEIYFGRARVRFTLKPSTPRPLP